MMSAAQAASLLIHGRRRIRRRLSLSSFLLLSGLLLFTAHTFLLTSSFIVVPYRTISSTRTTAIHLANNNSTSTFVTDLKSFQQSLHLIDVVEQTSQLKQYRRTSPDRATACCPFHNDNNPSFSMTPNFYKCFSCGASGNVFNFVQNYHQVSFGQALRMIQDPNFLSTDFSNRTMRPSLFSNSKLQQSSSPDRLRWAQLMAGAFFSHCLTQPVAGGARYYLLSSRPSFPARVIKQWGLGYAPDAYFSTTVQNTTSLTEHLRSLGFTPLELVEAGLAVPTKRAKQAAEQKNTTTALAEVLDFDNIMDRFRGRLMIPIMDATGQHILGFGGRSFSPEEQPKYLNSPESIIFSKGSLLFGQHVIAPKDTATTSKAKLKSKNGPVKPLLMVEGYMDVISLRAVGLGPAVATMGTAISKLQLEAAMQIVQEQQSHLVFCFDNDAAGVRAIERISKNGFLTALQKQYPSTIMAVATIPEGFKDPGEFVDEGLLAKTSPQKIAEEFETSVVNSATDWRLWYTDRVIDSCNCTTTADLRLIIDRIAAFWSVSMSHEQRLGYAASLAEKLAVRVSSNQTSEDMINVLREQIELNLVDQSSRMERTNQASDVVASSLTLTQRMALDRYDESDSMAADSLAAWNASQFDRDDQDHQFDNDDQYIPSKERRRTTMRARDSPKQKTLTPHFAGFRFTNQADRDWLGFSRKDPYNNYKLTLRPPVSKNYWRKSKDYLKNPEVLQQQSIYFNSNRYHGNQFLTEDAALAGYSRPSITDKKDIEAMATYGIGAVLRVDKSSIAVSTENTLLQTLVRSPAARGTIRQLLEARNAMQPTDDNERSQSSCIDWSSQERQWLFDVLVNNTDIAANATREFLLQSQQVPQLAFGNNSDTEEGSLTLAKTPNQGILEPFFLNNIKSRNTDALEQLSAQESFTNLLLLTAERRMHEAVDDHPELLRQSELVKSLGKEARRLGDRLFRESTRNREDSKDERYKALMAKIDEHLESLPLDDISPETQKQLDRIDRDWAVWTESWKRGEEPEPATKSTIVNRFFLEEDSNPSRETLEESLARIDRDWKYWIEKDT